MLVRSSQDTDVRSLKNCLDEVAGAEGVRFLLVLACDRNGWEPEQVDPILADVKLPLLGGVFPLVIAERRSWETGFVVVGFKRAVEVRTVHDLSDPDTDIASKLESLEVDLSVAKTLMLFVDGLSSRINSLFEELFSVFGLEANYIGGGAGSLSFKQKPCVLTNEGLKQDCAVIGFTEIESGIGVSHGWQELAGPFEVTESNCNRISSLDWKPAFSVYQDALKSSGGISFEGADFFEVSQNYPFGISKLDSEAIVRDLISVSSDGSIACVGEVPRHTYVHILSSDPESLIAAAAEALRRAQSRFRSEEEPGGAMIINCISRYLLLRENFAKELEALHPRSGAVSFGALTLGEIANNRKDYLEFYNKTSVVGVLEA